jgi:prevent-host-death family protein
VGDPVNIQYARTHLSKLIERAERGEEITIARAGKPVAKLTPVHAAHKQPKRKLGFLKGAIDIPPAFFDPRLDEEIAAGFESSSVLPRTKPAR